MKFHIQLEIEKNCCRLDFGATNLTGDAAMFDFFGENYITYEIEESSGITTSNCFSLKLNIA